MLKSFKTKVYKIIKIHSYFGSDRGQNIPYKKSCLYVKSRFLKIVVYTEGLSHGKEN